tara:strand:- start:148 stop:417 length:270 start_codon:yes stop_codon:yes gene_type:complete
MGIYLLLITSFIYFTFVAFNGNHGIKKRIELEFETIRLKSQLKELNLIANEIESKTIKLKGQHLDLDFLDEQARKTLALIRQDEIIILE